MVGKLWKFTSQNIIPTTRIQKQGMKIKVEIIIAISFRDFIGMKKKKHKKNYTPG